LLCHNEQFWELKYKQDFTEFDKNQYKIQLDYWTQWFPSSIINYDQYIKDRFLEASENWQVLYNHTFYDKITKITHSIFHRFDVREKYDPGYHNRKHKITASLIKFLEKGQGTKINTVVTKIKTLLDYHYKNFNSLYKFFGAPPDNDTAEDFLTKMVTEALDV
jgi:hypothetical protein